MTVSKELIQGLNDLLSRNRDAQKGYVEASNHINLKELSKWMLDYSVQRQLFSNQLDMEIRRLGGMPDDGTSAMGELHRIWIDLKGEITNNDPHAMLEECQRGEERALEDYDATLKKYFRTMPQQTMDMLNRHKSKIILAISQIKAMLKAYVPVEHS
ncbi:MAG: PA2169 family four-helix-bundle protein [Lewinellaceae bacterium]|nr:PA2169 family four-helix-bundle protein [Lewinellaceae bacterium]MCB9329811.1 PA2169 family four-helix-bundle protein [Lewinellaceae bacterium]